MSTLEGWVLRDADGREFPLPLQPGECLGVGRDFTSDVPILDAGVSREHARITLEGSELWLEDLHSQSGTFVNTERIYRARINSGDIITFGRVHLTLTSRKLRGEEADPLGRISHEHLAGLLRVSRELSLKRERSLVLRRILELGVEALKAERVAILLWDEERSTFHPFQAVPQEFLQEASRLISRPLGESLLQGGAARLLQPQTSRIEAGASSAIAAPLLAGTRPLGVLYLDRSQARPSFEMTDVDYLSALAWVAGGALSGRQKESAGETRGIEEAMPHEAPRSEKRDDTSGLSASTARFRPIDPAGQSGIEELILELEAFLDEARAHGSIQSPYFATRVLGAASLHVGALSRLLGRQSARREEIQIALALSEAAASGPERVICNVKAGGDLSLPCSPDALILVFRLAVHALLAEELLPSGGGGKRVVKAADAPPRVIEAIAARFTPGLGISVKLSRSPKEAVEGPAPRPRNPAGRNLSLELARRLVTEELGGQLQAAADRSWLELTLPQVTSMLGRT